MLVAMMLALERVLETLLETEKEQAWGVPFHQWERHLEKKMGYS